MSRSSVSPRPSNDSVSSGLGERVGRGKQLCSSYSSDFIACPVNGPRLLADVFPLGEAKEDSNIEEFVSAQEDEGAAAPQSLPTPYQPTRSEYLDHCVSHFPYRSWCRHCLEGRGREFGHSTQSGKKDENVAAVISFDYAFLSDSGEVTTDEEFQAAGELSLIHI